MRQIAFPLTGRLLLPSLAALVGAWSLAVLPSTAAIPDGGCALFRGTSTGNDPTQVVELELCRVGRAVFGEKASVGDGGGTVYEVRGTLTGPGTMELRTSSVLHDAPAEGWTSCADDVVTLAWSAHDESLIGGYVSAACEDHASLELHPVAASRYAALSSGGRDHAAWIATLDAERMPTGDAERVFGAALVDVDWSSEAMLPCGGVRHH